MSYCTAFTITCDVRGCIKHTYIRADSIDKARERAESEGWYTHGHYDTCPSCRALEGRRAQLAERALLVFRSEFTDDPAGDLRYIAGYLEAAAARLRDDTDPRDQDAWEEVPEIP